MSVREIESRPRPTPPTASTAVPAPAPAPAPPDPPSSLLANPPSEAGLWSRLTDYLRGRKP